MFSTHAGTRHKLQRSPILVSAHRFAIAQFGAGRTPSMRGTPVPPHGPAAIRRVALRTTTKSKRWLLLCESRRSRRTIGLRLGGAPAASYVPERRPALPSGSERRAVAGRPPPPPVVQSDRAAVGRTSSPPPPATASSVPLRSTAARFAERARRSTRSSSSQRR